MPVALILAPDAAAAVAALAADLRSDPAPDPFAQVPVLVDPGTGDGWLRTWLAHHGGIAAGLVVVGRHAGLRAAVAASAGLPGTDPSPWWQAPVGQAGDAWTPAWVATRILAAWGELTHPELEALRRYVEGAADAADARRLSLATAVAAWLDQATWTTPGALLDRARQRDWRPWLRHTVAALLSDPAAPVHALARVLGGRGRALWGPPLRLLGGRGLHPTERDLLLALGGTHRVALFRPTAAPARWVADAAPLPRGSSAERLLGLEEEERRTWLGASGVVVTMHTDDGLERRPGQLLSQWRAALQDGAPSTAGLAERPAQLMPAWSPRREVEQLRDRLLLAFAEERWEPRDVLVLTPDIGRYGPLLATIFSEGGLPAVRWAEGEDAGLELPSGQGRQAPSIPVKLAGLGLRQTNPLAAALLLVLELAADRMTAPRLHELASIGAVQRRFGIPEDAGPELRLLLEESGARWGLDGADKARVYGLPAHQNSLLFGLERMALSAFLHDEVALGRPPSLDPAGGRAALRFPMSAASRDRLPLAGALAALTARVARARDELRGEPVGPRTWRARLETLLDDLTETGDTTAWLRTSVETVLAEILVDTDSVRIGLEALRRLLRARFELPVSARSPFGSAVSVLPLQPGTLPPRPLVVLLGMSSGSFPRKPRQAEWVPVDPLAPDPVALQRRAFADAVLAAGDDLWLSWTARELKKGQELPPCTPVVELAEILAGGAAPPEAWFRPAGRHAWSPAPEPPPPTHAAATAAASLQLVAPGPGQARLRPWSMVPAGTELSPPAADAASAEQTSRELTAFVADLLNPSKHLLYGRVGVYLPDAPAPMPERETLELDGLELWKVRDRLLRELRWSGLGAQAQVERVEALVRDWLDSEAARGSLPLEAGAEEVLRGCLDAVLDILAARDQVGGVVIDQHRVRADVALPVPGRVLHLAGHVPELRVGQVEGGARHLHQWLEAGRVASSERAVLRAWVALCLARAQGDPVEAARLVGKDGVYWIRPTSAGGEVLDLDEWLGPEGAELALAHLGVLASLWWRARQVPLRSFKSTSFALAQAVLDSVGMGVVERGAAAVKAAAGAWFPGWSSDGDYQGDRWVQTVHPGYDPTVGLAGDPDLLAGLAALGGDGLVALARRLWEPVLAGRTGEDPVRVAGSPLAHWGEQP